MTTTSNPNVMVIIACYNGEKWLQEQLNSILLQTGVNITITARDDGSTDSTSELLRHAAVSTGRIKILDTEQPTGSAGRNFSTLIQNTPSDGHQYIAFSDQDDIWLPQKLTRAVNHLQNSGAAAYSSATIACWPSGKTRGIPVTHHTTPNDFLLEGAGQGCTFLLTSTFYDRVRTFITKHPTLFASAHYHDWAIYALARAWHLSWQFDQTPSMIYRQHSGNDTGARGSIEATLKRLSLIRSGWYKSQLLAISRICLTANPSDKYLNYWHGVLTNTRNRQRTLQLMRQCVKHGRRKRIDNIILLCSVALGWI